MAFPTILVNSATGSDTLASGAGPATALTGAAGVTSADGLTVVLDGSPDLTNVATDGSHVLFMSDTNAGSRNFGKITSKGDSGLVTAFVGVSDAFQALNTDAWAIGGKRASIASTTSKKLADNNTAAGDAMPGWIIEMESGHAETIAAEYAFRRAGDQVGGAVILRGTSGAGTKPVLTFSNNGNALTIRANFIQFWDLELQNTNATKTSSIAVQTVANIGGAYWRGLKIANSTNNFFKGIVGAANSGGIIQQCEVGFTANDGVELLHGSWAVLGNYIHDCTTIGIDLSPVGDAIHVIEDNLIADCGGDGIFRNSDAISPNMLFIRHNTIYSCGDEGIEVNAAMSVGAIFCILDNIISDATGTAVLYSNAAATLEAVLSVPTLTSNNNTFNNGATYTPAGIEERDPGLDPQFVDAANDVFTIGTNLKAQGFPEPNFPGLSYRSYVDIGGVSREEPASGGGGGKMVVASNSIL